MTYLEYANLYGQSHCILGKLEFSSDKEGLEFVKCLVDSPLPPFQFYTLYFSEKLSVEFLRTYFPDLINKDNEDYVEQLTVR